MVSAALAMARTGKSYSVKSFSHVGARSMVSRAACTVAEGWRLPEAELSYFDKEGNVHTVKVSELTRAKKVVLFAVPGAFTPTCSTQHVPGFVAKAAELRKAGADVLACVSVNDAFVMRAWGEQMHVGESVLLLSDGLGKFTQALGAAVDLSDKPVGLGLRSRRYAMVVDDGVVQALHMEDGGAFTHSSADHILQRLHQLHKPANAQCSAGQNVLVIPSTTQSISNSIQSITFLSQLEHHPSSCGRK
jgi:peroxiredoxin